MSKEISTFQFLMDELTKVELDILSFKSIDNGEFPEITQITQETFSQVIKALREYIQYLVIVTISQPDRLSEKEIVRLSEECMKLELEIASLLPNNKQ